MTYGAQSTICRFLAKKKYLDKYFLISDFENKRLVTFSFILKSLLKSICLDKQFCQNFTFCRLCLIVLIVSKSQKEILDSPHTPKNQRFFLHFLALASKSGQIKRTRALYYVK